MVVETKIPDIFAIVHAKNTLEELFYLNIDQNLKKIFILHKRVNSVS
ncbi:hypothetical protein [Sulfuricurvum sp.]